MPAVELLERPASGRVFTLEARVRLGDVDTDGRLRLDAAARHFQDAAADDATDASLDRRYGWLVRRTLLDVSEPPRLGEAITVDTWCTALGVAWAERRSQLVGARGGLIDAVSLWVQIELSTGRPAKVREDFSGPYGPSANGRAVSASLSIPDPPAAARALAPWPLRRSDLDVYAHVNNAATWAFVEDHVELGDRRGVAEIEYLQPISDGTTVEVVAEPRDGSCRWLRSADGIVTTAARWTPA